MSMSKTTHSQIRVHLAALHKICREHRILLTVNSAGVNISSDESGCPQFVSGLDEVADVLTNLEENRTGERLQ